MVAFVLKTYDEVSDPLDSEQMMFDYAKFLSQKLELWMFVPCKLVGGVWVVLEEPINAHDPRKTGLNNCMNLHDYERKLKEFQEAKDRVLFEGFKVIDKGNQYWVLFDEYKIKIWKDDGFTETNEGALSTIEDLTKHNLELTRTAQKQIGLC